MSDTKSVPVFNNRHLRFVFVAFLFSAAIADVGRGAVKVFGHSPCFWPAATHLAVAFAAISMSWVYWARNIGDGPQLKDIYSSEYLLLVIDLFLVIIYIGIAQSAELPSPDPMAALPTPSAVPESLLLAVVYFVYVLWDVVHDVWKRRANAKVPSLTAPEVSADAQVIDTAADSTPSGAPLASEDSKPTSATAAGGSVAIAPSSGASQLAPRPTVLETLKAAAVRSSASLVSCVLAVLIVATARSRNVHSNAGVCLLNLAELGNLFLFRSLKAAEYWFDGSLHAVYQERVDRYADVRRKMGFSTVLAGAVYAVALLYVLAS